MSERKMCPVCGLFYSPPKYGYEVNCRYCVSKAKMQEIRTCPTCGKGFKKRSCHGNQVFCTPSCAQLNRRRIRKEERRQLNYGDGKHTTVSELSNMTLETFSKEIDGVIGRYRPEFIELYFSPMKVKG